MRTCVTAALSALMMATSAHAGGGNWNLIADPGHQFCQTIGHYSDGTKISFSEGIDGWNLIIGGVASRPRQQYKVYIRFSNGRGGYFYGTGSDQTQGVVFFPALTLATVVEMAKARSITVEGLGKFGMPGSRAAIMRVHDCWNMQQQIARQPETMQEDTAQQEPLQRPHGDQISPSGPVKQIPKDQQPPQPKEQKKPAAINMEI